MLLINNQQFRYKFAHYAKHRAFIELQICKVNSEITLGGFPIMLTEGVRRNNTVEYVRFRYQGSFQDFPTPNPKKIFYDAMYILNCFVRCKLKNYDLIKYNWKHYLNASEYDIGVFDNTKLFLMNYSFTIKFLHLIYLMGIIMFDMRDMQRRTEETRKTLDLLKTEIQELLQRLACAEKEKRHELAMQLAGSYNLHDECQKILKKEPLYGIRVSNDAIEIAANNLFSRYCYLINLSSLTEEQIKDAVQNENPLNNNAKEQSESSEEESEDSDENDLD